MELESNTSSTHREKSSLEGGNNGKASSKPLTGWKYQREINHNANVLKVQHNAN